MGLKAEHTPAAGRCRRMRAGDLQIFLSRRSPIVANSARYLRRVSVRPFYPSVHTYHHGSHWTDFREI